MDKDAPLAPGLYVVSTPIGAARDITLRALDVLAAADVIVAEDTRVSRRLMEIHGIRREGRPVIAYHDHNGAAQRPRILEMLEAGQSVAQVSDAGTPMVADPGFDLARAATEAGHAVHAVPGASSPLAALVVSGLPSDRFLFAGFLPTAEGAKRRMLEELASVPATLIFFESGRRCLGTVKLMESVLGDRSAAVCRELTKKFETTVRGSLGELAAHFDGDVPKGEIVILVDRDRSVASEEDRDRMLEEALKTMSVKDAAREVAGALDLPRKDVYAAALALGGRK
ncbi:MAG: 16S rRNA (cytidine(1402)-2'-O)-methyltransferase [Pseudomonadota bacterium]